MCRSHASASPNVLIIYLPCLQGELEPPEPMQAGDLDECFFPFANEPMSAGPESLLCEMGAIPFNPVQSWLKHESGQGEGQCPTSLPHPNPKNLFHGVGGLGGGGGRASPMKNQMSI